MVLNAGTTTVVQATPNPVAPGGTVVLQAMVTLDPASTATLLPAWSSSPSTA